MCTFVNANLWNLDSLYAHIYKHAYTKVDFHKYVFMNDKFRLCTFTKVDHFRICAFADDSFRKYAYMKYVIHKCTFMEVCFRICTLLYIHIYQIQLP
jgi:hypothetical protein